MDKLPADVITHIFAYLRAKVLLRCARVCRAFYGIIEYDAHLQYHLELDLMSMTPSVQYGGEPSYPERLTDLRRLRDVYQAQVLRLVQTRHVEFEKKCDMIGFVSAGGVTAEYLCSTIDRTRYIEVTKYYGPKIERLSWVPPPPNKFYGIAMEPSEDALFGVHGVRNDDDKKVIELIVLRLLNGEPHPLVKGPALLLLGEYGVHDINMQVQGDKLAVYLKLSMGGEHVPFRIIVVNWKTGAILHVLELPGKSRYWCFVSPSILLVFEKEEDEVVEQPFIRVFHLEAKEPHKSGEIDAAYSPYSREWAVDFHLPGIKLGGSELKVVTTMTSHSPRTTEWSVLDQNMHTTLSDVHLVNVQLFVFGGMPGEHESYRVVKNLQTEFIILAEVFTRYERYLSRASEGDRARKVVPWDIWGPDNSRCFQGTQKPYIHGWLVATNRCLMNFNQREILQSRSLWAGESGEEEEMYSNLVLKPDVVPMEEGVFVQEVVTKLPYTQGMLEGKTPATMWNLFWGSQFGKLSYDVVRTNGEPVNWERITFYRVEPVWKVD